MSHPLYTGRLIISGSEVLQEKTYATLPGQASHASGETAASVGEIANISDGSTSNLGAIVVGGGSSHVLIRYDGTNWVVLGGSSTGDGINAAKLYIANQVIGDMLYADSTTSFTRLAGVAAGSVMVSGGVGIAPAWSATPTLTSITVPIILAKDNAASLIVENASAGTVMLDVNQASGVVALGGSHTGSNQVIVRNVPFISQTTIASAGTILSSGPAAVNSTSAGGFGFSSGVTAHYSFGANAGTAGTYSFQTLSSDASINVTPLLIKTTGLQVIDGTTANPTYSFISETGLGCYRGGATNIIWAASGNVACGMAGSSGWSVTANRGYNWSSGNTDPNASFDTQLTRASAGIMGVTTGFRMNTDVFTYRSATKTLKIDTDGAGGALTLVDVKGPITASGEIQGTNLTVGVGNLLKFNNSRSNISSSADGLLLISNNAGTGFTRLILGTNDATTNGFSWKLNAGNIEAWTGDGAGNRTGITGQNVVATSTLTAGGGGFNVISPGTLSIYNNINTAGKGVAAIYGENISGTQTSNFTALSYVPPATAGRYEVSAVITTTSATNTGTVQVTVDYVDSQGTTHTADVIPLVDAAGSLATTKTGASKEFHTIPWKITINNSATAIVLKVVITGSVSYTVSPTIKQEA